MILKMTSNQDFIDHALKDHWVVERLKKRIIEIRKLLENKDLTTEQSTELQYWMRENTMALGDYDG